MPPNRVSRALGGMSVTELVIFFSPEDMHVSKRQQQGSQLPRTRGTQDGIPGRCLKQEDIEHQVLKNAGSEIERSHQSLR